MYGLECRAANRSHSTTFKMKFSNAELNVDSIARYSKCYGFEYRPEGRLFHSSMSKIFMNAELNVEPVTGYCNYVWFTNAES